MPDTAGLKTAVCAASRVSTEVLDQAAEWLVKLNASDISDEDRLACEQWRSAHPEHALAWARVELLMNTLGSVPPKLAMPTLNRPHSDGRRAAMLKLVGILALTPAAWLGWRLVEQKGWIASHTTSTGQRRSIQLADGSAVILNTATSIDLQFDELERTVILRHGEILVETARDTALASRPFRVRTNHGLIQALGTRFSVRERANATEATVFEHAVRIEPRRTGAASHLILQAGQSVSFTTERVAQVRDSGPGADAWTHGMLMADGMRLAGFIDELARYRHGFLRCAAAIADLRISGTFPINDTDMALDMLAATYPVVVQRRLQGYWVVVGPA